ncbi:MAG: FG-GAP-like repeat-containing protein [Bifidobacteriaceae bacterium]|nr:FG-GAP-like repeat-containing protein [Bifidobacteriaceae bacterium]
MQWTGSLDTCDRGTVDSASQQATFDAINYYRRMAGLDPVTENTDASAAARRTALTMAAELNISHTPPATWKCTTNNGRYLANKSNLALGTTGAVSISRYIADASSAENISSVGHRRWILSPGGQVMGSGSVRGAAGRANALVVMPNTAGASWSGGPTWDASQDPALSSPFSITWSTPNFVAWPPAGYFPHQLAQVPWSVSTGRTAAGFASASVSVTKNGAAVAGVVVNGRSGGTYSGAGDVGHISFSLPDAVLAAPASGAVDTYKVSITGITGSPSTLSYEVKVFTVAQVSIGSASFSGSAAVDRDMTATATGVTPADAALAYQWLRNGDPISGATAATYRFTAADVGQRVSVRITGAKAGHAAGSYTSGYFTGQLGYFSPASVQLCAAPAVGAACAATSSSTPAATSTTYVWKAAGAPVGSGASYTPAAADLGKALTVTATFQRASHTDLVLASNGLTVLAGRLTAGTPAVSGTAKVGSALTAAPGTWAPAGVALAYQWLRDGAAITGATAKTYTLVAADQGKKMSVRVTGTLAGYTTASATSAQTSAVAAAGYAPVMSAFALSPDMTGDGLGEVLAVDGSGRLRLFKGTASGFNPSHTVTGPSGLTGSRVYGPGDWSSDGRADLAVIDARGDLWVHRGDGKGSVAAARSQLGNGWSQFLAIPSGDLTGDGQVDLLGVDLKTGVLYLYRWRADVGRFAMKRQVGNGWLGWQLHAAGDLNGDGRGDILGIDSKGDLYCYAGRGDGTFKMKQQCGNGWGSFQLVAGADLDGDKLADIVGRDNATGQVYFYKGKGQGRFAMKKQIASGW